MCFRYIFFFIIPLLSVSLSAEEKQENSKISEAFGHLIGKNIDAIGVEFDVELLVKGLRDAVNGKSSPMSETECIEAIAKVQEKTFKETAQKNLQMAETFLKGNAKNKNVVVLEEGKLQYKVEKKGQGNAVEAHCSPIIRYTGKYLDGSIFGQSKQDERISLDETIRGFQKGLVGMKEGEKRTLYIHPEYGYGTQGLLPPNSLLSFEIEIVKADAPLEEPPSSLILESDSKLQGDSELPTPALR